MVHPMNGDKSHRLLPATAGALLVWLLFVLLPAATMADEIIMITGETFSSPKIWEEDGKIRFSMHGLLVSVEKSEVAQIIRSRDGPQPTPKPIQTRNRAPAVPLPPQNPEPAGRTKPVTRKPAKSPRPVKPSNRKNQDQALNPSAAVGIGLEGLSWHLEPSDLPDLKKLETDPMYGGIDQYYRENETMQLGPAALDGKIYGFWRNRLYMITMWVEGPPAYHRLRQAVFERYGRGRQNSDGLERYIWEDSTTDRMLEFDEQLNTGLFWMRSRALDDKIKQSHRN
jgi:hypothetical protein